MVYFLTLEGTVLATLSKSPSHQEGAQASRRKDESDGIEEGE